jgi:hypothetical protein
MRKLEVKDKDGMTINDTSVIKKKSSTFYLDNRKDALRAPQKLARLHPWQVP